MSISRVSSYSHSQSLISGLLRNQSDMYETQQQVNTGKKSQSYQGYAQDTSTLISARNSKSRTDTFVRTAQAVSGEMQTADINLDSMIESARAIKDSLLTAIAEKDATGLRQSLDQNFQLIGSSLNSQSAGSYNFAGTKTDTKPFTPTTLDELVASEAAGTTFANNDVKASAKVADTVMMEYGILADEVAGDVMAIISDIHAYDTGGGNLEGALDQTQIDYLQSKLDVLDSAIEQMQNVQVQNGLNQKKLDEISNQMSERSTYLETFIGDIEDVDMAEAISRLNADQTALEASYRVIAEISQLSLAKFL